ncbi:MAG: hypothetical protein HYU28_01835 [Actinobacteria bacterium]|nr:hypothetical protein [Actinomycetota bacterium]
MGRLLSRGAVRRRMTDESGTGVVTALMITIIVFTLGATWTSVAVHQVQSSSHERRREQALNAAEAGINYAFSQLSGDAGWAGTSGPVPLGDATGEFEVSWTPVDPSDPDDLDRYIVAKGYAPAKASDQRAARQLEQQVTLVPTDGFSFALFASPGGVAGQNNSTITGDVYSAGNLDLSNSAKYFGDVVALGNITSSNNSTVGGDVQAGGNVTLDNSATTVQGNLLAGGNVTMTGTVLGDVQAGGSISGGTVEGTVAPNSPPSPPPTLSQPTFTWDPANYSPTPSSWSSASAFTSYWNSNLSGFSGHHRITGGSGGGNTITLDKKWTMTGDVTIVTDGPIVLSRDIANGTSGNVNLTVISLTSTDPAVSLTNNLSMPSSIRILIYAPNARVDFSQLKDFHGVVYADGINLSQQFTLSYAAPDVPGFSWDASSAVHFDIEVRTFREVPFSE